MLEISITDYATPMLDELLSHADHMDDVMDDIGRLMVDSVHQNFEEEGRPAWEPRLVDVPWPILRKTGALYNSIHYSVFGAEVNIDTDSDYGMFHQEGTDRMVARPFLEIQPEDETMIMDLLYQHFDQ